MRPTIPPQASNTSGPEPQNSRDKNQERRDLLALLLLLLGLFACLLVTAQLAIMPAPLWQVPANMLSELNPDKDYQAGVTTPVPPLRRACRGEPPPL